MHNLIVQTAFIGDLLLSIPLIRNTQNLFPEDRVVLLCRKGFGAFFKSSGLVDDVIEIEKSNAKSYAAALAQLQGLSIRHVIVPHQSFRSARLIGHLKVSGLKVGFRRWWNFLFFDKRVVRPMQYPDAIRQLSLLAAVDARFSETFSQDLAAVDENLGVLDTVRLRSTIPDWASMRVTIEGGAPEGSKTIQAEHDKADWKRAKKNAADKVDWTQEKQALKDQAEWQTAQQIKRNKLALVAPGSVWPTKRWHRQGFIDLLKTMHKEGYEIQLIGTKEEIEVCQYIKKQVPGAHNLAGRTSIAETIQLMSTATVLICNDSGAMHMASVVGLPTVSIFGPTTLALGYRPWNDNAVVVQKSLSCRPCSAHGTKKCPLKTHACMQDISSAEVLAAVQSLDV